MVLEKLKTTLLRSDLFRQEYGRYKVENVEKTTTDADPPESDPKLDLLLEILARMP